jgi:hypothetical protein
LTDKCTTAAEGQAWHTSPTPEAGKESKPKAGAAAQGGRNNNNKNKKKADVNNQVDLEHLML